VRVRLLERLSQLLGLAAITDRLGAAGFLAASANVDLSIAAFAPLFGRFHLPHFSFSIAATTSF
jgi:hypothetical protein